MIQPDRSLAQLSEEAFARLSPNYQLLMETVEHPNLAQTAKLPELHRRVGGVSRQLACVATRLEMQGEPTSVVTFEDRDVRHAYSIGRVVASAAFLETIADESALLYVFRKDFRPERQDTRRPLHEVADAVLTEQGFEKRKPSQDSERHVYLPGKNFYDSYDLSVDIVEKTGIEISRKALPEDNSNQSGEPRELADFRFTGQIGVQNLSPSVYSISDGTLYQPRADKFGRITLHIAESGAFRPKSREVLAGSTLKADVSGILYQYRSEETEFGTHPLRFTMSRGEFLYYMSREAYAWTDGKEHFIKHFQDEVRDYMTRQFEATLNPDDILAEVAPQLVQERNMVDVVPGALNIIRRLVRDFAPQEPTEKA